MHSPTLEKLLYEISPERIQSHLENLAEIGKDSRGGVTRLAYTPEECEAFDYLKSQMKGYANRVDPAGNMYIEPTTNVTGKKFILIGSHLDTVTMGGKYDGTTGVISGLEILLCLQKYKPELTKNLSIVSFRAEESARFSRSLLGSSAATGQLSYENTKLIKDKNNGITLEKAMKDCSLEPERIDEERINPSAISSYLELHIEQGPILEKECCPIGIVTVIAAPIRYKIKFHGRSDHSGTTPMDMRKDALVAASKVTLLIKKICDQVYSRNRKTLGTVGYLETIAGEINKVPGEALLGVDLRSSDKDEREKIAEKILRGIRKIENETGVKIEIEQTEYKNPVLMSPDVYNLIKRSCEEHGLKYKMMPSGAGHDAMNFPKIGIPAGMIFIPCHDGRSHCPDEYTDIDNIVAGTKVLLTTYYLMSNYT